MKIYLIVVLSLLCILIFDYLFVIQWVGPRLVSCGEPLVNSISTKDTPPAARCQTLKSTIETVLTCDTKLKSTGWGTIAFPLFAYQAKLFKLGDLEASPTKLIMLYNKSCSNISDPLTIN